MQRHCSGGMRAEPVAEPTLERPGGGAAMPRTVGGKFSWQRQTRRRTAFPKHSIVLFHRLDGCREGRDLAFATPETSALHPTDAAPPPHLPVRPPQPRQPLRRRPGLRDRRVHPAQPLPGPQTAAGLEKCRAGTSPPGHHSTEDRAPRDALASLHRKPKAADCARTSPTR